MSIAFKSFFIIVFLSLAISVASARSCFDLFRSQQVQSLESRYLYSLDAHRSESKLSQPETLAHVHILLQDALAALDISKLPNRIHFAVSISKDDHIHVTSKGLNQRQHDELLSQVKKFQIDQILTRIPKFFRNKYFEIQLVKNSTTVKAFLSYQFAKDISFPIKSHFLTGFATVDSEIIRRYNPAESRPGDLVNLALQQQNLSQETLATCGVASICKVLAKRNIPLDETDVIQTSQKFGIKNFLDVLGAEPGFELWQLSEVLNQIGKKYGFTAQYLEVQGSHDKSNFMNLIEESLANKNLDIIANFYSPVIGRPGAGHFSPIAGLNLQTGEVLVSEVNLAMNPSYWVHADLLFQAMGPQQLQKQKRGYIVITWSIPQ